MSRVARAFTVISILAASSCAAPPDADPIAQSQSDESSTADRPAASDSSSESDALAVSPGAAPRAGCSVVQFCNQDGPNGSVCVQQGCEVIDAINECLRETASICGGHVCPWIFKQSNGAIDNLCANPP